MSMECFMGCLVAGMPGACLVHKTLSSAAFSGMLVDKVGVEVSFPMHAESWFGKFWSCLWAGIVQDVPASLEECEACREVDCTQERWLTCERRLAAETTSLAGSGTSTGRTDEVPGLSATEQPQPAPEKSEEANEEASDYARRRKISIH
jgi:hypothetical protein